MCTQVGCVRLSVCNGRVWEHKSKCVLMVTVHVGQCGDSVYLWMRILIQMKTLLGTKGGTVNNYAKIISET